MDINLLFKIAAIGILVAVLNQVLVRAGREDQAMMTTLAGIVIVLSIVINEISELFTTVRTLFNLEEVALMEIIQIIGIGLTGVIIAGILKEYKPEFKIYVSIVVGIVIFFLAVDKLSEFINLIHILSGKLNISSSFINILLKVTGISILTEFAVSICKDSGESAIASKIDLGGKILILSMSVPIIMSLLETLLNLL